MSARQHALDGLESQINQIKNLVETRSRIQRLQSNSDFSELINRRYMIEEAAGFAHNAGNPALKPEERGDALQMALAPGHLKRWLSAQITMANQMEDRLPELENARDVLRAITDEQFENNEYSFGGDTE